MTYKTALQAIVLREARERIYALIEEEHPSAFVDGVRDLGEIIMKKQENSCRISAFTLGVYDDGLLCRYRVKGDIFEDGTIMLDIGKEGTC